MNALESGLGESDATTGWIDTSGNAHSGHKEMRLVRLVVRPPDLQSGSIGSIPIRAIPDGVSGQNKNPFAGESAKPSANGSNQNLMVPSLLETFFMVSQIAQVVKSSVPVARVRRWNRTTGRYEWVIVTQEMIEADRRRQQYVAAFNPCGL